MDGSGILPLPVPAHPLNPVPVAEVTPPRPVEPASPPPRQDRREGGNGSGLNRDGGDAARSRAEGKGRRLDLRV